MNGNEIAKVIVELKSVENIAPVHPKQLLTYLFTNYKSKIRIINKLQ